MLHVKLFEIRDSMTFIPAMGIMMTAAHLHIEAHWDELESGDVVDLEFINGKRSAPKVSERFPQTQGDVS